MESEPTTSKAKRLLHKLIEVDKIINQINDKSGSLEKRTLDSSLSITSSRAELRPVNASTRHAPPVPAARHKSKKAVTKSVVPADFMKEQSTYCPACFTPMALGLLRRHMAEECSNNEVNCPEVDCKATFKAEHLKVHLEKECIPARRRQALVEQMRLRKEEKKRDLALLQEKAKAEHKQKKAEAERLQRELEDEAYIAISDTPKSPTTVDSSFTKPMQPPLRPKEVCEQCKKELPPGTNVSDHMSQKCPARLVYCPNQSGCSARALQPARRPS